MFDTDEEYYSDKTHLSNSMLRDFIECPYKFKMKHITGELVFGDKDYFLIGRALDTLVTEGADSFEEKFQVVARRTGIETEKQLLTKGDYQLVLDMLKEVLRQPLLKNLKMTPKKCQEVITVTIDGVKRKGKLDFFDEKKGVIMDLKTTANIMSFDPMMYTMQLAYYKQLVREKYRIEAQCHLFAVDKIKPKCRSQYYIYDVDVLDRAEDQINHYIELYRKAKKQRKYSPPSSRYTCFGCDFYPHCPKALQKTPTYITNQTLHD